MSQAFGKLPAEYFNSGLIAEVQLISQINETYIMNKIGGSKPFLYINEDWPQDKKGNYLKFICQYKHPTENKMVRFFLNYHNIAHYQFDIIDINQPYKQDDQMPNLTAHLPCYEIVKWNPITEPMDIMTVYEYYIEHPEDFKIDFSDQINDDHYERDINDKFYLSLIIREILVEEYLFSAHNLSMLKVGGTPYSESNKTNYYISSGTLMQLSNKEIQFPFLVGHILIDNLELVYEM